MAVKCEQCNFTAPYNSLIKRHQAIFHNDLKPWKCSFPGCDYTHEHSMKVDVRRPFACPFDSCAYRASVNSQLADHVIAKHPASTRPKNFQCTMCSSSFYSKASLRQHISSHVKEWRFKCNFCEFATHIPGSLTLHVNAKHIKSKIVLCKFSGCDFSTHWPAVYRRHAQTHEKIRAVAKPAGKPCPFPTCTHLASSAGNLENHIRALHNPNKRRNLKFPLCESAFFTRATLTAHVTGVHANQKVFACDKCAYSTANAGNLKLHCRAVHDGGAEKKFKCELCEHRACSLSKLDLHTRSAHTKEREFKCVYPGCSYATNYARYIKSHSLAHEKGLEKQFPFPCSFAGCDFRRRTRSEIDLHQRRHETHQVKLECKICLDKFYPDPRSLYFHECLAHDKKSYNCPVCNCASSTVYNFLRHMGTVHKMDAQQLSSSLVGSGASPRGTTGCRKNAVKKLDFFQSSKNLKKPSEYSALLATQMLDKLPIVVLKKLIVERL